MLGCLDINVYTVKPVLSGHL